MVHTGNSVNGLAVRPIIQAVGALNEEPVVEGGLDREDLEDGGDNPSLQYSPSIAPEERDAEFELEDGAGKGIDGSMHDEDEEATIRMAQRSPFKPTAEEIRQHNISHVPFRDWCVHCLRGKGRSAAHRRGQEDEEVKAMRRPVVSMDYFYLGKREDDTLPMLAILEESTQRVFSLAMPCKGTGHQYCVAIVARLVKILGLQSGIFKSDTERSLVALRTEVQLKFPGMGCEDAPKGESQSNGAIESAVGRLQAQARTLKSCLEEHYGKVVHAKHPILCWMVDYCGCLLSRFQLGADGRTPYERSTGKKWKIQLPEFGECILYEPIKGEQSRSKLDPKFEPGIYLGLQEGTGMRWIGTDGGVVRSWSIKRLPDEDKWNVEQLDAMIGLPWQLRPKPAEQAGMKSIPLEVELPKEVVVEEEKPAEVVVRRKKGYVPRGIYIRRDVWVHRWM